MALPIMKKQKQSTLIAETQPASNTKDLALLVHATTSNLSWLAKEVGGVLLRIKGETKLCITANTNIAIDDYPELVELAQKNRCSVVVLRNNTLLEPAIIDAKYVFIIDDGKTINIPQVINAYNANRKIISSPLQSTFVGVFNSASGKLQGSFKTKIKQWFYNFIAQLFSPAYLKDYTHQYYYFSKHIILNYYSKSYFSRLSMLFKSTYEEVVFQEFALSQKEYSPNFTTLGTIVFSGIKSRFQWFLFDPILNLRSTIKPQNAPIYRLGFLVVFLVALFLMPALSFDYGITWDAKRHNLYGYDMLSYFETDGENKTALSETSSMQEFRYYGEHFNVISAWLNTHIKAWGEFETRHVLNSLYGLLAMLFAAMAAKEIAGWRAGFIAFVFILFSPIFFGHSMNNPTDIPFAAGCSMALYYLIKVLKNMPAPKFTYLLWCGAGIGMAIGARIGGVVFYAYTGLFLGLSWLFYLRKHNFSAASKLLWPYFISGATIFVIGHIIAISLWPFGQEAPLTNWLEALEKSTSKDPSSSFFTYNHELFEGVRMYMANVPLYYLPKFIIINSPIFVLIGFLLLLALFFAWKKVFAERLFYVFVILFVFVFPIVYAEYQGMYYYNGWRHYLFTYPPLIVLTALGWDTLVTLLKNKLAKVGVLIAILGLLMLPAFWMVKNHPNEVVYYNELVGGTKGAYGNYEMDYYSNSCKEAAEWIAQQEPTKNVVVAINNEPLTSSYYANKTNPNIQFQWVREYEEGKPFWDYAIFTSRTYSKNELLNGGFPPKGTVYKVEVDGVTIAAVVKREVYFMPLGYKVFEANLYDSALYYFTQATVWNPMDEEAWRMKGMALAGLNKWDEAIVAAQKAIIVFPENYMALGNIGFNYMQGKSDYPKALEYFKKSNTYKFNYTDAYYYSGMAEFRKGDYMAGIKYLELATKRGGSSVPEIYYNIGYGYYNLQSFAKAEENLKYALTINPKMLMGYRLLAEIFTKQNKTQEAQFCMQKYAELGGR